MKLVNPAFTPSPTSPGTLHNAFDRSFKLDQPDPPKSSDAEPALVLGQMVASKITPGQERDLRFILTVVKDENPSPRNLKIAKDFLADFRPPKSELQALRNKAEKFVKEYVDQRGSRAAEYAQYWNNYSADDRHAVTNDILQKMNASLGTSFKLQITNTPPVNNQQTHGFYTPQSNTISINIHPTAAISFGAVMTTLFHEAVHGMYHNKTRLMGPDDVLDAAKTGRISYTDAIAYYNLTQNLYTPATQSQARYETQPHEWLANSGQEFVGRALSKRGIQSQIPTPSPIVQHINRLGL